MKSIRTAGLCLVAALVVSAMAAASAMAEAPEVGRCVAKAGGNYINNGCSKKAKKPGTGTFEWEPGAPTGTFTGKSTGAATLETKSKVKVSCAGETSTGEFTSSTEVGNVHVTFTGCSSNGFECESSGAGKGVVKTNTLAGKLVWEKKGKSVAIDLFAQPPGTLLAQFSCGPAAAEVKGSVLGTVAPVNKMVTSAEQKFSAKKGVQSPKEYITSTGEKVADFLESKIGALPFEESAQTVTNIQTSTSGEELEVSTVA